MEHAECGCSSLTRNYIFHVSLKKDTVHLSSQLIIAAISSMEIHLFSGSIETFKMFCILKISFESYILRLNVYISSLIFILLLCSFKQMHNEAQQDYVVSVQKYFIYLVLFC